MCSGRHWEFQQALPTVRLPREELQGRQDTRCPLPRSLRCQWPLPKLHILHATLEKLHFLSWLPPCLAHAHVLCPLSVVCFLSFPPPPPPPSISALVGLNQERNRSREMTLGDGYLWRCQLPGLPTSLVASMSPPKVSLVLQTCC